MEEKEDSSMHDHDRKYLRVKKVTLIIIVLIVGAGLFGWWLGHRHNSGTAQPNTPAQTATADNAGSPGVKSLVSYTLPDGWKEASCPSAAGSVFVIPAGGTGVDCDASPSSPVKISVDPSNSKDCNDLQNVQDVKKHVCISLYINGHKSLKASTEYLSSSSYKRDTTINAYYIDTGKGVVKVEYIYYDDNQYQAGFDQLAMSVKAKP